MASFWMTSFVLIERNRKLRHRLITVAGISLALFCPDVTHLEARVSYLSHALGFALGIPTAMLWFWWNKNVVRMSEVWTERVKVDFEWQEAIDLLPPEYFENLPEEPLHRH
jgi:hypothetical protein